MSERESKHRGILPTSYLFLSIVTIHSVRVNPHSLTPLIHIISISISTFNLYECFLTAKLQGSTPLLSSYLMVYSLWAHTSYNYYIILQPYAMYHCVRIRQGLALLLIHYYPWRLLILYLLTLYDLIL